MLNQCLMLKPSYFFAGYLILLHAACVIILLVMSIAWPVLLLAITLTLSSLIYSLNHYALRRSAKAIIKLQPKNSDTWLLQNKQGEILPAKLNSNSFCSLYCVVLNFKLIDNKKKTAIIILQDSLPADDFRRLRVYCRLSNGRGQPGAA